MADNVVVADVPDGEPDPETKRLAAEWWEQTVRFLALNGLWAGKLPGCTFEIPAPDLDPAERERLRKTFEEYSTGLERILRPGPTVRRGSNTATVLYFGAHGQAGHYLWCPGPYRAGFRYESKLPFGFHILDGHLIPPAEKRPLGTVYAAVINGWTVFSFRDCSGDSRPGSNSAFVLEGVWDYAPAMERARVAFPEIFNRPNFPVLTEAK